MLSGEPGALLAIEMLPLVAPADAGEKVALKLTLCAELRIRGVDKPVMLKPVPETPPCEIVTVLVPELVSVIVCDPLLPTRTLPKLKLEGLAARFPCTPVPLNAILAGDPGALLLMEMLPEALPVDAGAN
jgi:hypothetical protein